MEVISSLENKKVIFWSKLKQKKYRDLENVFLIEGKHLILEALKLNLVKEVITLKEEIDSNIPHYLVNSKIMKKVTNLETIPNMIAVVFKKEEEILANKILVLDNIQDPGNLGTLIRSAVAFNFKTIVLSENTVDLYNPKTIRATEGMLFKVGVLRKNLEEYLKYLKEQEYLVIGSSLNKKDNISEIKSAKTALIIGNEGTGMSLAVTKLCDKLINIKMNKDCESLNAAVAGSILMYELGEIDE